jgi:hypothetical protein
LLASPGEAAQKVSLTALFAFVPIVHAQTAAVSVRVEQETKQEESNLYSVTAARIVPGKYHFQKTQQRTIPSTATRWSRLIREKKMQRSSPA